MWAAVGSRGYKVNNADSVDEKICGASQEALLDICKTEELR